MKRNRSSNRSSSRLSIVHIILIIAALTLIILAPAWCTLGGRAAISTLLGSAVLGGLSVSRKVDSAAANKQWRSRPDDERYTSLTAMLDHVAAVRRSSTAKVVSSRQLTAAPVENEPEALALIGPGGGVVNTTHWSFGQLSSLAGAPAGYLRTLPGAMAADCINYGLHVARDVEDVGVLLYRNGGEPELRAATGPNYGRVWNETIIRSLVNRFGDGITGDFRVPGEFGKAVEVSKANTTLFASDRDMFVFLADEQHRIEMPNRRNGQPGSMARGFFLWNSEVGSQTFGLAMFLFDYVCCNRLVWGMEDAMQVTFKHTSSAPDKWVEQAAPAIEAMALSSERPIVAAIQAAQSKRIDDVNAFLGKRFSRSQVAAVQAAHLADEQRPIATLWDAAVGITAYARGVGYQDERVKLEREAGKVMRLAV